MYYLVCCVFLILTLNCEALWINLWFLIMCYKNKFDIDIDIVNIMF